MNLFSVAEWIASFGQTEVRYDPRRCVVASDRYGECQACILTCPAGAISAGKPPVFHEEKCVNCGACQAACPSSALHAPDPLAAIFQPPRASVSGALDLFCARLPQGQGLVGPAHSTGFRVKGCLASVSAGAYAALIARGFEHVWVRTDACRGCPWEQLTAQIERQVERGNQLLAFWGLAGSLSVLRALEKAPQRPLWNAGPSQADLSRRDLFRMAVRRPVQAPAPAPQPRAIENEDLLSRDRVYLLQAASQLRSSLGDPTARLEGLGFASLAPSGACTACGACARVCPTGALRFTAAPSETSFQLSFQAEACNGCAACLRVCSPAAITLDPAPQAAAVFSARDPVVLHSGALARCERCGIPFASQDGQHLCTLCAYRAEHPFGSVLPPGFQRPAPQAGKE